MFSDKVPLCPLADIVFLQLKSLFPGVNSLEKAGTLYYYKSMHAVIRLGFKNSNTWALSLDSVSDGEWRPRMPTDSGYKWSEDRGFVFFSENAGPKGKSA